jgi:phage shock protein PspC (stress-responsive transcriptional regulator)
VAAAIGRATNTDPVLWRVLLGVMTLFGGIGLLVYLLGWLLIPAEGDSASPAEALIGRGRSSTSAALALGLAVVTVIMFAVVFSGTVRTSLLGAAVILGAAVLVSRGGSTFGRPANTPPQPDGTPPPAPMGPPFAPPAASPSSPTVPLTPAGSSAPPFASTASGQGTTEAPTGYRPPFAPYGPYASSSPYAQSLGHPPPPPPQYPGLAQTLPPPKPPKPPRERSRLGRVVLSLACLALGVLAVLDISQGDVPVAAYLAVPLGIVGLGLVAGAWLGRARWLIFPGLALTVALAIVASAESWNVSHRGVPRGNVTWAPTNASELTGKYRTDVGNATLDLSKIDFRDKDAAVTVQVDIGNLVVILPPDVDVHLVARVNGGSADALGESWNGLGNTTHQVRDNGTDGPGGGQLRLNATVDLGKLEVHR